MKGEHRHDFNVKKVDRLGGTKVRLTVEFPSETVREHEKATANRYLSQAKIPGFRPGKAPLKMVRERYKNEIKQDVVSHLLEAGLSEALEQTKLNPVNRPSIQLGEISLDEEKPFEFHAEFEVEPEIELRDYKGIPLKESKAAATDEEVQGTLNNLRDRFSSMEPLDAEKPEAGNFAVVEIGYELVAEPEKKEEPKEFTVEVGAGKLLPALDAALLEMKVGESRDVSDTFPSEDSEASLAGKDAVFHVKLVELKKKVLPDVDDAFASQIKPETTLEALKNDIRESIISSKREDESRSQRNEIMEHLIKKHEFEVPSTLVQRQAYSLLQSLARDYKNQGFNPSELKPEDLETLQKRAEHMVRSSLLLREVATKESIQLDENRVRAKIDAIAGQLKRTPEDTEKFLEGKGMLDRIRDEVLTDQVFEFLVQNAQIEKA